MRQAWTWFRATWNWLSSRWRRIRIRVLIGAALMFLVGIVYLGPYVSDALLCIDTTIRKLVTENSAGWKCMNDMLDDLRKDGTAATVMLAIAAAILASAWSGGSTSEE